MARYIKTPCPLCHDSTGVTVRMTEESDEDGHSYQGIAFVENGCLCDPEEILSGPFDETVTLVHEWLRDTYPYGIQGEWYASS